MIQIIVYLNNPEFEMSLKYELEAEMNILCEPDLMQANHKQ